MDYRVTLIAEGSFDANSKEEAGILFWNSFADLSSLRCEIIIDEPEEEEEAQCLS